MHFFRALKKKLFNIKGILFTAMGIFCSTTLRRQNPLRRPIKIVGNNIARLTAVIYRLSVKKINRPGAPEPSWPHYFWFHNFSQLRRFLHFANKRATFLFFEIELRELKN